jgi:hypothetical protein
MFDALWALLGVEPRSGARTRGYAYGRRNRSLMRLRERRHHWVNKLIRFGRRLGRRMGRPPATHFEVVPRPGRLSEASDLAARLYWYLRPTDVPVLLPDALEARADGAPYMAPELIQELPNRAAVCAGPAHVLLTRFSFWRLLMRGRDLGATTIVDPDFYSYSDSSGYEAVLEQFGRPGLLPEGSIQRLFERRAPGGRAAVFGTGPSIAQADAHTLGAEVRIVCNSIVRNRKLLEEIRPTAIAVADPVFHFGPSRYASRFRADLLSALRGNDALLIVPPFGARLLLSHHPELRERIVVVPAGALQWRWPSAEDPRVRATGNVLTLLMLPVALSLADTVEIVGCDGRKPTERYFWRHGREVQYEDALMETAFCAHPSFFRDRDYRDYYIRHCHELEEFIALAERAGKRVLSGTQSHIPALARRARGAR